MLLLLGDPIEPGVDGSSSSDPDSLVLLLLLLLLLSLLYFCSSCFNNLLSLPAALPKKGSLNSKVISVFFLFFFIKLVTYMNKLQVLFEVDYHPVSSNSQINY